jgi:putative ABC transport system ATP-binding protein
MTTPHVIDARDLVKAYRKGGEVVRVLGGVTLQLSPGDFISVRGRSGSGKSTLLNILGCLDRPDSGTYLLDGTDVSSGDDALLSDMRNRTLGFVFQQFHLLERVSALRNVGLPFLYTDQDVPDPMGRALEALEAVGLAHRASHTPAELSGGEQQRVAVARALVNRPRVLLADEPTGNLDERSAAEVLQLLEHLRVGGLTIVLVTHDQAVARRADRRLLLEDGVLHPDGDAAL